MAEYFVFRETSNNGWMICPKHEMFGTPFVEGGYATFACRMLGLSFPDWLRLCQQNGAKLYGKQIMYIHAVWKEPNKDFLKMINERATAVAKQVNVKELPW